MEPLQVKNPRYQRHPFDGDGMVCSFAFKDGTCHFQNRYVRTRGFQAEQVSAEWLGQREVHFSIKIASQAAMNTCDNMTFMTLRSDVILWELHVPTNLAQTIKEGATCAGRKVSYSRSAYFARTC